MPWINDHGIQRWEGEFIEASNKELKAYRAQSVAQPQLSCGLRHGTPAGAKRHYRAKEPLCDKCREAERKANKVRRDRAKKQCVDCSTEVSSKAKRCTPCENARRARKSAGVRKCDVCGGTYREGSGCATCTDWAEKSAVKQSWRPETRAA